MKIGAIADDFTGATDLANTLTKQGCRVVQTIGVPDGPAPDADAVVVALKSRSNPVGEAVDMSLAALNWLKANGAEQIIFKYCSTFDSTAEGNIGPVGDALAEALGAGISVICPAFPATERSIYMGHLFVGSMLLSDSPLKDHPLNPMTDASLIRLMDAQSGGSTGLIPLPTVRAGTDAIAAAAATLKSAGHRWAVVDAVEDADLLTIGAALKGAKLVTGGSGIALGLPANFGISPGAANDWPKVEGRQLVLAGSCSAATREQIARVPDNWAKAKVDVDAIARGEPLADTLVDWANGADGPVLIYASADPTEVAAMQAKYGRGDAGEMVERILAELASRLTAAGFARLIVAGGETSGAVVSALGIDTLRIHSEIAPGVPWTSATDRSLALALKSGNFGGPDFFEDAFGALA